jgi:hypothetical protein
MKLKFALICLFTVIIASCSDDEEAYKCSTCSTTPDANAAYDASAQGVYKGLVVGSSGTIQFNIKNDGSTYSATLVLDGETYELTTSATANGGFEGCFTGTMNTTNDISICMYASSDGQIYDVTSILIPGHANASIALVKELSTALVSVYEGTFSGDASGVFNMVTQGQAWAVVARTDDNDTSYHEGLLSNGTMSCPGCDINITGTVNANEASGSWSSTDESGSWTGKRTL